MARIKTVRNYEDARKFVRGLGLKDTQAWRDYVKSGKRPSDIPSNPWVAYRDRSEKFSLNDFIGAKVQRGRPRKNESKPSVKAKLVVQTPAKSAYEIAKEIVRALQLKNRAEFTEMSKNGLRPAGVPARPDLAFTEWEGWATFLGNEKSAQVFKNNQKENSEKELAYA